MIEPRYLADTNILVYLIGGSSESLRARVEAEAVGAMVTSTLCVAEALAGKRSASEIEQLESLLDLITPLPFDLSCARAFMKVPFKRGRIDRLIGAQALALGLIVVTNNVRDFNDIPGLGVEDWM